VLRLGELHLAAGDASAALDCGDVAVGLNPYDEQAHRLVIAAMLQRDDAAGVRSALARLDATLHELGSPPEPATEVLRRRAVWRYPEVLEPVTVTARVTTRRGDR
jgi:LuxR family transcriptional regulator, maltose regulon positive regulatory protein